MGVHGTTSTAASWALPVRQTKMEQIAILGWRSEDARPRMDNLISKSYTDKKLT